MSYFSYADLSPDLWRSWLRRFAREQRAGHWLVTACTKTQRIVMAISLKCNRRRCAVHLAPQLGEMTTIEFYGESCH
jgi:hypothetical protein